MKTKNHPIRLGACWKRLLKTSCLAAVVALAGASIQAQNLSFEPFSGYTEGVQLTANIPAPVVAGYSGNWTNIDFGSVHPVTTTGSLAYGGAGYAAGVGDHIEIASYGGGIGAGNSGRMFRMLDNTLKVTSTTAGTLYLSFLYKSGQEAGATVYQMLDLYNGDTADAHRTFTAGLTQNGGNSGSEYDFGVNEAYTSTGVAADTAVHLFVVKFTLSASASSDSVTVWIDPTLGAGDPAGGITISGQNIAFDRLAISDYSGGNSGAWDEIRWGTTFNSVTVVAPPTPTVFAPVLSATPHYAPVSQTIPLTITIPTNANASSTVKLVLTNDNPTVISLPGGSLITNTFAVGATNVQVINALVVGTGLANINVVTNATFSAATIQLGALLPPNSFETFSSYAEGSQVTAFLPSPAISGYSGDWTSVDFGNVHPVVTAGSLAYGGAGYAAGLGDHIEVPSYTGGINAGNSGRMYRVLAGTSLAVDSTTSGTRYLSFLFKSGQEAGATIYQMLDLYNGDTADAHRTFNAGLAQGGGNSGSEYDFGVNESYTSTGVAADTAVHLFVVKFDLSTNAASDSVTVWLDPALGAGEPAGGITISGQDIAFDRLSISDYSGGNSGAWDEIRWGTTFDSVTITAPPAAAVFAPVLSATPRYAPVGQTIPLTVTIPADANTLTTVKLVLTNDNPSVISLPGGTLITNTFTAGATNVQVINATVVGPGLANISVVTNATFTAATVQLGALLPPTSFESFALYSLGTQLPDSAPSPVISGYSGNWTAVDFGNVHPTVTAGSLAYSGAGYAAGVGSHLEVPSYAGGINAGNSGRMFRVLTGTSLAVDSTTSGTRYLSFLYKSGQEAGATIYQMLDLYNGDTADAHRTFTAGLTQNGGNSGSEYDFGVNEAYTSTGVAADTAVHLFVVKFDLSTTAASDSVTVWIDPTLGAGDPAGGITISGQDIAFDRLAISDYSGGNSGAWDEIRWGTNFNSVTIVAPPPLPTLSVVLTSPTQLQISWPTNVIGSYTILSSTNLLGPWISAGLNVSTSGDKFVATDSISGSAKYYRLQN